MIKKKKIIEEIIKIADYKPEHCDAEDDFWKLLNLINELREKLK